MEIAGAASSEAASADVAGPHDAVIVAEMKAISDEFEDLWLSPCYRGAAPSLLGIELLLSQQQARLTCCSQHAPGANARATRRYESVEQRKMHRSGLSLGVIPMRAPIQSGGPIPCVSNLSARVANIWATRP